MEISNKILLLTMRSYDSIRYSEEVKKIRVVAEIITGEHLLENNWVANDEDQFMHDKNFWNWRWLKYVEDDIDFCKKLETYPSQVLRFLRKKSQTLNLIGSNNVTISKHWHFFYSGNVLVCST